MQRYREYSRLCEFGQFGVDQVSSARRSLGDGTIFGALQRGSEGLTGARRTARRRSHPRGHGRQHTLGWSRAENGDEPGTSAGVSSARGSLAHDRIDPDEYSVLPIARNLHAVRQATEMHKGRGPRRRRRHHQYRSDERVRDTHSKISFRRPGRI